MSHICHKAWLFSRFLTQDVLKYVLTIFNNIMDIKNKTVLVTGGASGLGQATVEAVIAAGRNAVILDIN